MYVETSSGNHGHEMVLVRLERTDIIQITNITFYCNRFSSSDKILRAMERFRVQLLLEDNFWSTQYTIAKNSQYSETSTKWSFLNLDYTVEKMVLN